MRPWSLHPRHHQLLRILRRPQPIRPSSEIALHQIRCRNMSRILEPGFARQRHDLLRRVEADERRAAGLRASLRHLQPGVRRWRFHAWGPERSTSNTFKWAATCGLRCAKLSSPAPRITYWPSPPACLFRHQVFNEAGARHDRGAKGPRELRAHISSEAPLCQRHGFFGCKWVRSWSQVSFFDTHRPTR